ncbi:MAG: mraW [Patescibacteria group bacterium]|nr:mraW [Patescibacteria group bacterium]
MHIPVLFNESIEALSIKKDGTYVDGTLGGAGHACEIARHLGPDGTLIGFDLDSNAIARAKEKLTPSAIRSGGSGQMCKVILVQENFRNLDKVLEEHDIQEVEGIFLDLGWSSFQIADASRGLSFQEDGPLKMTLKDNPGEDDVTAYDIVNSWDEKTIADTIYTYGDERASRRIAKAIVDWRRKKPIITTFDLVSVIESVMPRKPWMKTNPATKTFQALRIATNDEYGALGETLEKGFERLKQSGRFAIISFHSGEDRIVKNFFRDKAHADLATLITKKPITPSEAELAVNPRARSSKLRILEKI